MINYEIFCERILDNTFRQISDKERISLIDNDNMKKYVNDIQDAYDYLENLDIFEFQQVCHDLKIAILKHEIELENYNFE